MTTADPDGIAVMMAAFAAQVGGCDRPLALLARFRVRAGAGAGIEDAFERALAETAREPGAIAYQLHREPDDRDAFVVYECWRSLDDLEAHLRTPYVRMLRRTIDDAIEGPPDFRILIPA